MKYPKSLEELIECFKLLPGIGEKNAERLSFAVLQFSEENSKKFSESIENVKTKIKKCSICNNYTEESDICEVCSNESRDKSTICVVENVKDLILFEKSAVLIFAPSLTKINVLFVEEFTSSKSF